MSYYFITFRSVTHAQRGEQVLQREGHRCAIQRTPRWMEEKGCGYSLRLRTEEIAQVLAALRRAGVPLRKVYLQRDNGELEELRL